MSFAIAIATASDTFAQSSRAVLFGHAGYVDLTANDSEQGKTAIYGGELLFRFGGPWHVGADVSFASLTPTRFGSDFRQTSVLASAVAEWPRRASVRALAGGGFGWLIQRTEYSRFTSDHTSGAFHGRGGVVGDLGKQWRVRAEVILAVGGGLSAIGGVRAGIGYVF
jgi:hypothetical protein